MILFQIIVCDVKLFCKHNVNCICLLKLILTNFLILDYLSLYFLFFLYTLGWATFFLFEFMNASLIFVCSKCLCSIAGICCQCAIFCLVFAGT